MKFMLNGALTIGTLDGANVEMAREVGDENIFIFGLKADEVDRIWQNGYCSSSYFNQDINIRKIIESLIIGFNGQSFSDIADYLLRQSPIADPYMCLADFESYLNTHDAMTRDWRDREKWNRMSLINIAKSGYFSADRAIREYADNIWHLRSIK